MLAGLEISRSPAYVPTKSQLLVVLGQRSYSQFSCAKIGAIMPTTRKQTESSPGRFERWASCILALASEPETSPTRARSTMPCSQPTLQSAPAHTGSPGAVAKIYALNQLGFIDTFPAAEAAVRPSPRVSDVHIRNLVPRVDAVGRARVGGNAPSNDRVSLQSPPPR